WKNDVIPVLRKTGTEKLALTVTVMCQRYLGLREIVEDTGIYPCEELMECIIENGNFGRKSGTGGKVAAFSFTSTDAGSFFKRLQKAGLSNWKAAKEHRILRPFAWIYQSFRIIGQLIKGKVTPKKFREQRKKGIERRKLIKDLGLDMDREIK
ncbi:MAG: hypothetical protein J5850_03885, partial [Clostridia bacterium]|nr:hypothetical protein [Clostridia bacterium]